MVELSNGYQRSPLQIRASTETKHLSRDQYCVLIAEAHHPSSGFENALVPSLPALYIRTRSYINQEVYYCPDLRTWVLKQEPLSQTTWQLLSCTRSQSKGQIHMSLREMTSALYHILTRIFTYLIQKWRELQGRIQN
jgi:hypothetical protein